MITKEFTSKIKELDTLLREKNPKNYAKLQAPLSKERTDDYLNKIGIDDPYFRSLYNWKNGAINSIVINTRDLIFDFGITLSLEQVLHKKEYFPDEYSTLIPFVEDGTGDALLFNTKKGSDYGMIYVSSVSLLSMDDPYSYYDSIYSMIETTMEAYKIGALKYTQENDLLERDYDKFRVLAKKINKNSNFWNQ